MSSYTNCAEVTISDVARITFFEILNSERTVIITLSMQLDHLKGISDAINKTLNDHQEKLNQK